jgi:hypothetical protein
LHPGRLLCHGLLLFIGLTLIIAVLSFLVGCKQNCSVGNSLYFACITGVTKRYGDRRPTSRRGGVLAKGIALFDLKTTGILAGRAIFKGVGYG